MRIVIVGAGKVGTALADALDGTPHPVELWSWRRFDGERPLRAGLVVLAVRDGVLPSCARALGGARGVSRHSAVVHVSGSLGPEVLAPLRGRVAGVGQAHPAVSFPAPRARPSLAGAALVVAGDPVAVRRATLLGRAIGFSPLPVGRFDRAAYHAGCALAANGAAVLAAAAGELLVAAGIPAPEAARIVGPLLRSVAENVATVGLEASLSGPIRRGDAPLVAAHLERIASLTPAILPLYRSLAARQLEVARSLGEATPGALAAVAAALVERPQRPRRD